jgi:urease beta subunit
LSSLNHPKHERVIAHVQVVAQRKFKAARLDIVEPTAVRFEAGGERRARSAASINQLRIADAVLDTASADLSDVAA